MNRLSAKRTSLTGFGIVATVVFTTAGFSFALATDFVEGSDQWRLINDRFADTGCGAKFAYQKRAHGLSL